MSDDFLQRMLRGTLYPHTHKAQQICLTLAPHAVQENNNHNIASTTDLFDGVIYIYITCRTNIAAKQ